MACKSEKVVASLFHLDNFIFAIWENCESEKMVMLTMGLDIGTTTISIVVMDRVNKKVVETGNIPNDSFLKTENSWEKTQDAELILKKTVKLLNEYLLRYPEVRFLY